MRTIQLTETRPEGIFVLGVSGSRFLVNDPTEDWPKPLQLIETSSHDSAAVLLAGGDVVVGIEEERLDRLKHSNRLPLLALSRCLEAYGERRTAASELHVAFYGSPADPTERAELRALIAALGRQMGVELDAGSIHLVGHHFCHAASAFFPSPFQESLVVTVDGQGDGLCVTINIGREATLEVVKEVPWPGRSLGYFYERVTRFLGFGAYDEYKVMGLAPYGDPARFRGVLGQSYRLLPGGEWSLRLDELPAILRAGFDGRAGLDPESREAADLAATVQEALEVILLHVLRHYRAETGLRNLCMAGGVALNCTANRKILESGLFDDVFVQPASHDGGAALGAALAAFAGLTGKRSPRPMNHVYWGTAIDGAATQAQLGAWQALIEVERCDDVFERAAALMAEGEVLGWVGGRAEFGPRALGNRSILADPRPVSHKDRINAMVKKREAFRPFAPAVAEEFADEFFEVKPGKSYPWMIFVAGVRPEKRELLGAVTHVDGTARIQTVARESNPRFWRLLSAFKARTGVPVLLNTSFNNNAEPIVDTVEDAVVCFLTTGLDCLVIDDYLVRKRALTPERLGALVAQTPAYVRIEEITQRSSAGPLTTYRSVCNRYYGKKAVQVSAASVGALKAADGRKTVAELLGAALVPCFEEWLQLWSERLVRLAPDPRAG